MLQECHSVVHEHYLTVEPTLFESKPDRFDITVLCQTERNIDEFQNVVKDPEDSKIHNQVDEQGEQDPPSITRSPGHIQQFSLQLNKLPYFAKVSQKHR